MQIPIRLLIHGATGRMGSALLRLAGDDPRFRVVAAISRAGHAIDGLPVPVFATGELHRAPPFDLAVDFSLPGGFDAILAECLSRGAGLVSGTTGLDEPQRARLAAAAREIPVLWASNFSLGVLVLNELVRRAAKALPGWQVEITETHHLHKKDAPSGTAKTLAATVAGVLAAEPVIRSVREGEVVGLHRVRFSGLGETVELAHEAVDRDIFARGALEAAARLHGRPAGNWPLAELILA